MYSEDGLGLLAHTFNLSNVGAEVGGAPLTPGQPALLMISRPSRLHRPYIKNDAVGASAIWQSAYQAQRPLSLIPDIIHHTQSDPHL